MKIILSGDEIIAALEAFRSRYDPDNALTVMEIIVSPAHNKAYVPILLEVILMELFRFGNDITPTFSDIYIAEEMFRDSIDSITILNESCDILLTMK